MRGHLMVSSSLLFLLLLMVMCGMSKTVQADGNAVLFQRGKTQLPTGTEEGSQNVDSFSLHSFVDVSGVVLALAKANYAGDGGKAIWGKYIRTDEDNWVSNVTKADGPEWKTQLVAGKQTQTKGGCNSLLEGPKAVVKEGKVYLLFYCIDPSTGNKAQSTCESKLRVGSITTTDTEKSLTWEDKTSSGTTGIEEKLKNLQFSDFVGTKGRGTLMKNGSTIVFPLGVVKDNKKMCAIIYSEDNGTEWKLPSNNVPADSCINPSLIEWEGKLLMIATHDGSDTKVYESADMGETWTDLTATNSSVLTHAMRHQDYGSPDEIMTTTIEGKNVILLTAECNFSEHASNNGFYLWMTDGLRMYILGDISLCVSCATSFSSLLHTKGELFFARDGGSTTDGTVSLLHLTEKMNKIKSVITTWKNTDEKVLNLCSTTATTGTACSTNGLIGFLSNEGTDTYWGNEYLGVNATMHNGEKTENGFTFKGSSSWAKWPMSKQGFLKYYHYANKNFTLLATVKILKAPTGTTPLIGVKVEEKSGATMKKLLDLSYTNGKRWETTLGTTTTTTHDSPTWDLSKEYQVAIVLQDGSKGSVYIDGQRVGSEETITTTEEISHFYIGGDGSSTVGTEASSEDRVTVTNVLLYNRPLSVEEINAFNKKKATFQTHSADNSPEREGAASQVNTKPAAGPSDNGLGEKGAEKSSRNVHEPSVVDNGQSGGTSSSGSNLAEEKKGEQTSKQQSVNNATVNKTSNRTSRMANKDGADGSVSGSVSGMLMLALPFLGVWWLSAL